MLLSALAIDYTSGLPLIGAAGVAIYIANKSLVGALCSEAGPSPGRTAIGQWLPIAVMSIEAILTHRPQIAVGLLFSTSVASLSLLIGAVALLGVSPITAESRRAWALLLPVSLLAFLSGFRGYLGPFNAAVLAVMGLCVLLVWNDRKDPTSKPAEPAGALIERSKPVRFLQFILALCVAGVGAWLGTHAVDRIAAQGEFTSPGLLTAALLSPLFVLPSIGTGTELSHRQQGSVAVGAAVGVGLLNGCLLLPLVVVASYGQQYLAAVIPAMKNAATVPALMTFHPVSFPLAVWRVDAVIWIALGLFLLPVGLGRWSISKGNGLFLMCGYVMYLTLAILMQQYMLYGLR